MPASSERMQVVQLVPALPPSINGLGDYAFLLAREMRGLHGVESAFLVGNPKWHDNSSRDGFEVCTLSTRTAPALSEALDLLPHVCTVLLHYVGYAYQKRGCPIWLVSGLAHWLKARSGRRLVTMFHELYAFGPPWRSSFWTSPVQRFLAAQLARLSATCFTNRQRSAWVLRRWRGNAGPAVQCLPVFSNFGEPTSVPALAERAPQMVIYGGLAQRGSALAEVARTLNCFCKANGITRLLTFGSQAVSAHEVELPLVNLGFLGAEEVSRVLLESRAGYLDYFDGYLAKSGVFAAYCAHGLLPVLLRPNRSEADGLHLGGHYIELSGTPSLGIEQQQKVATAATRWYQNHASHATAQAFGACLVG